MKISKHLHSCLLIEENGITVLIDPGIFTAQEKALNLNKLTQLDYILITHEHPDHMFIPLIKELLEKFPSTTIITTSSASKFLEKENIASHAMGNDVIQFESFPHEKLWDVEPPQNILVKVFGRLTHPGDSHHFNTTTEILALPIQAPWGSTIDAVELAVKLKPKIIIPIHDWMWKDGFRQTMYTRLEGYFAPLGIEFKGIETGEVVEVKNQ